MKKVIIVVLVTCISCMAFQPAKVQAKADPILIVGGLLLTGFTIGAVAKHFDDEKKAKQAQQRQVQQRQQPQQASQNQPYQNPDTGQPFNNCQPMSSTGVNEHGNTVINEFVMCFDTQGRPYIQ